MGHKLVFDLETKKTFDEVGGQGNAHLLGISVVGVYNYSDDSFLIYKESELSEFKKVLANTDLLIGFNSRRFDNAVLQPYYSDFDLSQIPHIDMLEDIEKELGFRVKLENLAQMTLGEGKSGSGLDAIRYYRLGEHDKLNKYCLDDVRVTRDVYEYGKSHGYLWYLESGSPQKVKISWGEEPFVDDIIKQALEEHRQVKVEYIKTGQKKNEVQRIKTTLDVRAINGNKIKALCHVEHKEKIFDLPKFFKAELNGIISAYQQSLI